jgi:hypothetical protein
MAKRKLGRNAPKIYRKIPTWYLLPSNDPEVVVVEKYSQARTTKSPDILRVAGKLATASGRERNLAPLLMADA